MTRVRRRTLPVLVFLSAWPGACKRPQPDESPLAVAAAADLAVAFEEIEHLHRQRGGGPVSFTFGSTGQLAQQLANGAPFDLFAAANVSYVDDVVAAGVCQGNTRALYARGRIGVWTPRPVVPPAAIADLTDARFKKIAIANPAHAPYGRAAQEALRHAGLWTALEARMVFGENVQQTLQFARSGNADAALVAQSLAGAASEGTFLPIDPAMHQPIDQALVVCGAGSRTVAARAFAALVLSPEGQDIMKRHGFVGPR